MVLAYSCSNVSILPVKKEPNHKSELVNQLLFGEKAEVLEINEKDWARIRVKWDEYEGWCRAAQLEMIPRKSYNKEPKFLSAGRADKLIFGEFETWLPLGSEFERNKVLIGKLEGKFKGKKVDPETLELTGENLVKNALHFLHAPYLWGGKTIAGIDCSGLVQMAFKLCNYKMLRDAAQQATEGITVDFLQDTICGDLAFFDNAEGKIVHVGILVDSQTIIHATDTSGRVVVDKIDQAGIISTTLKKRTHNLRVVKRYF